MHIDDFRTIQRDGAATNLHSLFMSCRARFLNAARLLEIRSAALEGLLDYRSKVIDLAPLLGMYNVICDRYADSFFSPQGNLFPEPADAEDAKWGRYFYQTLKPSLLGEDQFVRNVLRATGALPCREPEFAREALVQHVYEMTLPETPPRWAPECESVWSSTNWD